MSNVNEVIRVVALGLYEAVLGGLVLGMAFYVIGEPVDSEPLYVVILMTMRVCVGLAVFVGSFFLVSFGVFWVVINSVAFLSSRYPSEFQISFIEQGLEPGLSFKNGYY